MRNLLICGSVVALLLSPMAASAALFTFSDPGLPGLAAEAEFTLIDPSTLEIRLRNTSTGVPGGFSNSDQILTGISFDFGVPGYDGDPLITGGFVIIGPTSASLDFDSGSYGPGYDVSGEWGYGNMDGTGALTNFASANTAVATPFGGANLDGPVAIDGPQAGLVANPEAVPLGGLGAIQDEVLITLTISPYTPGGDLLDNLDFLYENLVRVEFGSDAAFITVPEPSSIVLVLTALLGLRRRRS